MTVPEVAERLGLAVSRVKQLLRDHKLLAVQRPSGAFCVPAAFLDGDQVVRGLHGTLTLLFDCGFDEAEALRWLFTADVSLPGTPIIRYGDEIGMGDDLSLPERYAARTPMQWSRDRHGGFTTARRPIRRVVGDPIYGYAQVNVADQRRDPNSLLNWTERLIRTRKECPEIGWRST